MLRNEKNLVEFDILDADEKPSGEILEVRAPNANSILKEQASLQAAGKKIRYKLKQPSNPKGSDIVSMINDALVPVLKRLDNLEQGSSENDDFENIVSLVQSLREQAGENDQRLTEKGHPNKAWVEGAYGKPIDQAVYLKAIKA